MRELLIVRQRVGWKKKNKNKQNERCVGLQTGVWGYRLVCGATDRCVWGYRLV